MNKKKGLALVFIFFATFSAYINGVQNDFLWDDEFLVQKNKYLRNLKHLPQILKSNSTAGFGGQDNFYRPTQNIYYFVIFQLFGENKVAFHLGNILLHTLNALLLFFVALRLTKKINTAFIASLLWAIHPAHTEAITYISGTADPMGALFLLLSILCLPRSSLKANPKRYALSVIFCSLSILSKEAFIIAPALLSLIIAFEAKNPFRLKQQLRVAPHWLFAFSYLLLRKTVLNFDQTFVFFKKSNIYTENIQFRIYTYLASLPEYFKILIYPVDLHMERSFPVFVNFLAPNVLIGLGLFSLTLLVCIYLFIKQKKRLPLFSWLWFFGTFVPMNGILIPVNSFILEHWLYFTSIPIFFIIAQTFEKLLSSHRKSYSITLITLTFSLIYLTAHRNQDWKTPITFYNNILEYSTGSARIHNNLAMAYSDKKLWELAIKHYQKAINTSDIYPQTHYNLARAYIQQGKHQLALKHLEKSLKLNPNFIYSKKLRQQLLSQLGRTDS